MGVYGDFSKHPRNLYNPQIMEGIMRIEKQLKICYQSQKENRILLTSYLFTN